MSGLGVPDGPCAGRSPSVTGSPTPRLEDERAIGAELLPSVDEGETSPRGPRCESVAPVPLGDGDAEPTCDPVAQPRDPRWERQATADLRVTRPRTRDRPTRLVSGPSRSTCASSSARSVP